jgi:hypothetical protein
MMRIYIACSRTLSFMRDAGVIRVCLVGANGCVCVVLGENRVFRILWEYTALYPRIHDSSH